MREGVHNVFGFATGLWISSLFSVSNSLVFSALIVIVMAIVVNWFIDRFGGHKAYRRTPYTHSLFGVSILSFATASTIYLVFTVIGLKPDVSLPFAEKIFILAFFIGLSHLLLDSFTADGTQLLWPFSKKRIALTRRRYDDPLLNGLASLFSFALVLLYICKEMTRLWLSL